MASALIGGLIRNGRDPSSIIVLEPSSGQREAIRERLGVRTLETATAALADVEVLVWAVKPQVLRQAASSVVPHLRACLHISIAAGIRLADLTRWLNSHRVVRAMPNTSALVGAGVTGMLADQNMGPDDRDAADAILAGAGFTFWVDSDERLDAVTAISGSGPAYVFKFLEDLQSAAQGLGFDPALARELALKTVEGAALQAHRDGCAFRTLRERVTSKRGTTEAALAVLISRNTAGTLAAGVEAAYRRAGELSVELGEPALQADANAEASLP